MSNIKGVVERSLLTSSGTKNMERRRRELLNLSNPAKRRVGLMLHFLATHYPDQMAKMIGMELRDPSVQLIGAGWDTIVYKTDEDTVKKVHRSTIYDSARAQEETVDYKVTRNNLLRAALPDFTLPQTTYRGEHPYYANPSVATVVLTEQAFLPHGQEINLFSPGKRRVDPGVLAPLVENDELRGQLIDFVAGSRELTRQGLVPDLGVGNLVITETDQLRLIDGQPAATVHGSLAMARLDSLEKALL